MTLRRVLPASVLVMALACAPASRTEMPVVAWQAPEHVRVQVEDKGSSAIRAVPLEDYVAATILSEFAPAAGVTAEIEQMYEVQAIISRTYGVMHVSRHARDGFDLCSTTHCQLYQPGRLRTSRWAEVARMAASRTAGAVVWFGEAPAATLYHADCGGHTSDASAVWGGRGFPYLAGVEDDGPAEGAHMTWRYTATVDAVRRALARDPRTRSDGPLEIAVVERDDAGRATMIALTRNRETRVRAETVREVLTAAFGPRAIRSTRFDVRRDAAGFHFEGRGFGHGVGLCQAGARARIRAGATRSEVLLRYYPGTTIVRLRTAP